ncbi:hypothetical protein LX59_01509 [Azomonas agilis]|uniref:Uncharacterized protein n=1 Tax=Azomonas agilis TaxID=116849 RepID=A0A562IYB9_9GAMM|nr:hypothetical protein [Azomonas agilis]TWH75999.1 hypothetical protein LX59_01509 [Azomonas agilis]
MSILNGSRLNFWGGIRTDVSVPNNSPSIPVGSENETLQLFDLTISQVAQEAQSYTDDQLNNMINAPTGDYYTAGGWNHYGQHVVDMQNVLVSSQGSPNNISTVGDLVGQPVYLLGSADPITGQPPVSGPMMVDLDPTNGTSTQIYIGGLLIGTSSNPQLLIRSDVVASSFDVNQRLLNGESDAPGSSKFSGTFQVTFPLTSIVSWNQNSPILKDIIEAPEATGIVVRFVMFEMCPTMTTQELDDDYAANQFTPNPSIGRVIGTLATAFADEPLICPVGRQLVNKDISSVGYAQLIPSGLSIDMVNLIPKENFRPIRTDITSPIEPNINYGDLSINAGSTLITTLDSNSSVLTDYYLYGGIVDISLTSEQTNLLQESAICITGSEIVAETSLNIYECPYRIYCDQRNLYMSDYPQGISLSLQVRYLGGPIPHNTFMTVVSSPSGSYKKPEYWDLLEHPKVIHLIQGQTSVEVPITRKVSSYGQAGYTCLTYSIWDVESFSGFTNFRCYANTDFGIPAGSMVTWEQVYPYVLRFHYLAFPAMSRYIPLNQQDAIWNARQAILARTSDAYKGTTLYMPVVRSMSPSQRALLKAYLTNTPWQPL